jgi:serine phosphatase RsbU (regulator of sigma subunit)
VEEPDVPADSRLESVFLRLPAILADLDPVRLSVGLTDAARDLTGAEFGIFSGIDEDELRFVGAQEGTFADLPAPHRAPLLAPGLRTGEPLRIDDVSRWALSEESALPYGSTADGRMVRSYLSAPVRSRAGQLLGSMLMGHRMPRAFDRRAERLLAGLCDHLAVALENAELFQERAHVARALQQTLLPPLLPAIPGVELAARYRATGAGNLVGGDFYDVFEVGDGEWGVVLGDVSGFGPEAAALTGLARYTVRAVAGQEEPGGVLRVLNRALCRQHTDDRFCSAVYLRLCPNEDGSVALKVAVGGHPPPLVVRDSGTVTPLVLDESMLLGLFTDAQLCDRDVELSPGDSLVLYTDGVVEARDPGGQQFGQERLEELLTRAAGRTADGIARRVDLSALDFSEGRTLDDVAVVVIRAAVRDGQSG